jgi:hypothetical protein
VRKREQSVAPAADLQSAHTGHAIAQGVRVAKIKVLLFAANPPGTDALGLNREFREIDQEIRFGEYRDGLELIIVPGTRLVDLFRKLNEDHPDIVQFSGHGNIDEETILETGRRDLTGPESERSLHARDMRRSEHADDASGACSPRPLSKSALVDVLNACNEENIRVVVLNACHTRPQAEALSVVVDCVVSMNRVISDVAAIKFAASFYGALAFGRSVKKAFDQGVARLKAEGISETGTPELVVRAGVDASTIVLVGPRENAEAKQPEVARTQDDTRQWRIIPTWMRAQPHKRVHPISIIVAASAPLMLIIIYSVLGPGWFSRSSLPQPNMPKDRRHLSEMHNTAQILAADSKAARQVNPPNDERTPLPDTAELIEILDMRFNALVEKLKARLPNMHRIRMPSPWSITRVDQLSPDFRTIGSPGQVRYFEF